MALRGIFMTDAQPLLGLYEGIMRCVLWEQGLLDMQAEGLLSGFYHAGRGQGLLVETLLGVAASLSEDCDSIKEARVMWV